MGAGLRGVKSLSSDEMGTLKKCDFIFVDGYTAIFPSDFKDELTSSVGKTVTFLGRQDVEDFSFIDKSAGQVALIVSGDAMVSTTHFSILRYCRENGISYKIFENSSILSAIPGRTGLSSYRTGNIVSIPDIQDNFVPRSPLQKIFSNLKNRLHTTILIDLIDSKNLDAERVQQIFRKMSDDPQMDLVFEIPVILLERIGWNDEEVFCSRLVDFSELQMNSPYCMVMPFMPDSNEIENMAALNLKNMELFLNFDYARILDSTI